MFSLLTQAWRSWKSAKAVALLAIAALAVGIGSTTAIYTVVHAVLLRPLPFAHGERYVNIFGARKGEEGFMGNSWLNLLEYQRRTSSFDAFGIYQPREFNLTAPGAPRHLTAVEVTPSLLAGLGVRPLAGQWFSDEPRRAVISEGLWQSLGGDRSIIGKTLTLDGEPYTVTGVAPGWFRFPVSGTFGQEIRADVWVPLNPQGSDRERSVYSYFCTARMKPGVTLAQADADVKRVAAQIAAEFMHDPGFTGFAIDLLTSVVKEIRPTLLLLFGAAAALLIITCANVAGLLLARSVARARETAVRVALGATRRQLALQYFAEGLLIALAGAALGVVVSGTLVRFVLSIAANWIPRADEIGTSGAGLLFTCAVAMGSCLLFSMAPMWQASRTQPNETLSDGARSSANARSRGLSRALVIAEIALSFTLLTVGAVLMSGLAGLMGSSTGFEADQLVTFGANISMTDYPKAPMRDAFEKRLASAIGAIPGVRAAAYVNHLPLDGCCYSTSLTPRGRALNPVTDSVAIMVASGNYLETMRIPLVSGRFVRETDNEGSVGGVAINQAAARALWPGVNPVGRDAALSTGNPVRIVGVVRDVKNKALDSPAIPEVYLNSSAGPMNPVYFLVRSRLTTAALVPSIQRAVAGVDRTQSIYDVRTMQTIILDSIGSERLRSYLIAFFAAAALLMAMLGVYGVVSYSVRNRTVEIGTRMALGAVRSDVLRLVIGDGLRMAGWGILAGGLAVTGAVLLLKSAVFGITIDDPRPFLFATAAVAGFAALACLFPAWRAMLLTPMVAIRDNAGSLWESLSLPRRSEPQREGPAESLLLAEFVEASREAESFRDAIVKSQGMVREAMNAAWAAVLEKDAAGGFRDGEVFVPGQGLLAGRLRRYPFPLPLSEGDYDAWERWSQAEGLDHSAEIAALRVRGAALAVPLLAKNELAGLLLLGAPVEREVYSPGEKSVLRNCAGQFALMIENARLTERIVEQEKLRRDVQLATEVQKRLFPDKPPITSGISLAGMSLPARGVGGDYYDFLDLGDQRVGIALADVAGKGVAAALIMSVVQASLRIIAVEDITLAEVAAKMNRYLHKSTRSNGYATFFYAVIDEERRQLRYVNAGHNPPYLLRHSAAGEVSELPAGGTVIGLFPSSAYEESSIDLAPGDVLIAFTDGVPEALNPADEEFGEERVREMLVRWADCTAEDMAERIAGELKAWIAGADQYDDLTFILVKVGG